MPCGHLQEDVLTDIRDRRLTVAIYQTVTARLSYGHALEMSVWRRPWEPYCGQYGRTVDSMDILWTVWTYCGQYGRTVDIVWRRFWEPSPNDVHSASIRAADKRTPETPARWTC
ncbi:hypothetical protein MRX96_041011 [Rhipicephalus microplus]